MATATTTEGSAQRKVHWIVRTDKYIVAHVYGEDFTTFTPLQDVLVCTAGVSFASFAVPEHADYTTLCVRMAADSPSTAEQAVQSALQSVLRKCARFINLAREKVPSFGAVPSFGVVPLFGRAP